MATKWRFDRIPLTLTQVEIEKETPSRVCLKVQKGTLEGYDLKWEHRWTVNRFYYDTFEEACAGARAGIKSRIAEAEEAAYQVRTAATELENKISEMEERRQ